MFHALRLVRFVAAHKLRITPRGCQMLLGGVRLKKASFTHLVRGKGAEKVLLVGENEHRDAPELLFLQKLP